MQRERTPLNKLICKQAFCSFPLTMFLHSVHFKSISWKISKFDYYFAIYSCSERDSLLKEAEILHQARFSYILPILGICNEPQFLGIVTEYMPNGSLNQLLYEVSMHNCSKRLQLRY